MARIPVFYSFYFDEDYWRVQQVRQMGVVEGEEPVSKNDWETVRKNGPTAIQNWIDEHMNYKRCVVVLVGANTHTRPWVKYEIAKAWASKKGLVGIRIHNLKNSASQTSYPGISPFDTTPLPGYSLSTSIQLHDPGVLDPYGSIRSNLASWVESAVTSAQYR